MILFFYILKEIIPQFISSLLILVSVLVISQLARLTEYLIAFGVSFENLFMPLIYTVIPFIPFNIPIAFLFAVMITFGRLSADGEFAGFLSCGFSLRRASQPVGILAIMLLVSGVLAGSYLEPWGRRELVRFIYDKTKNEVDNMIRFKIQPGVFTDNFLGYTFFSEEISKDRKFLRNVMLSPPSGSKQLFTIVAPRGKISGTADTGDLKMTLIDGRAFSQSPERQEASELKFRRAEFDLLRLFREQLSNSDVGENDYRSLPPGELLSYIERLGDMETVDSGQLIRARYLYFNRIASPFSIFFFGFFGLVLGVVDPRSQKNRSYGGAIAAIIFVYVFMMAFKWLADRSLLDTVWAAWAPPLILAVVGAFLFYQKNRLPPSEGILELQNMPWRRR